MAQLLFKTELTTKMHDIDAAGVMFFGRYFYYAHDTYEQYLNKQKKSISDLISSNKLLPIVHSEADFKTSIGLNETIGITLYLAKKTAHSYTLEYHFYNKGDEITAIVKTVHVCIDKINHTKKTLPDNLFV